MSRKQPSSVWRLRAPVSDDRGRLLGLASLALLFVVWCVCSYVKIGSFLPINHFFLPPPDQVLKGLIYLTTDQGLLTQVLISVRRVAIAMALTVGVAVPLGVAMGSFDVINRVMDPIMAPLRYMPITAFIPLLILWFGIYETQKIVFLFLGTFVFLLPVVVDSIRAVPEELVQTAFTLGASKLQAIRTVLVPAAMPQIFDAFRVMNAIAWTYIILAELVNSSAGGIGYILGLGASHTKPDWSFAGILVVGVIGLVTDAAIRFVNHFLFRWREADA